MCFLLLIYAILKLYFLLCARISKDYKVRQPWEISTYILLYQSRHGLHDYGAKKRAEICLEMKKMNYVVRYAIISDVMTEQSLSQLTKSLFNLFHHTDESTRPQRYCWQQYINFSVLALYVLAG